MDYSCFVKESKKEIYGVDIGTYKIVISRASCSKEIAQPTTIADMMDIRNIPNRINLSHDLDQIRSFGNSVSSLKKLKINYNDPLSKYDVQIGSKKYSLPGYIIKNMIMSHVYDIIEYRKEPILKEELRPESKQIDRIVVTLDHTSSPKNKYYDLQGINCILSASYKDNKKFEVVPIRDDYAIIMAYLDKYILQENSTIDIKKKNVMIINVGHTKSSFVLFNIERKNGIVNIMHLVTFGSNKLAGEHLDNILANLLETKTKHVIKSDSKCIRSELSNIKHRLSSNSITTVTLQDSDSEMGFNVSRDEYEKELIDNAIDEILKTSFENVCSHLNGEKLDHVELVGGSSRTPFIRRLVQQFWNTISYGQISKISSSDWQTSSSVSSSITTNIIKTLPQSMNQDETVSNGAAVYGWLIEHPDVSKKIKFNRYSHSAFLYTDDDYNKRKPIFFDGKIISSSLSPTDYKNTIIDIGFSDRIHVVSGYCSTSKSSNSKDHMMFERDSHQNNLHIIISINNNKDKEKIFEVIPNCSDHNYDNSHIRASYHDNLKITFFQNMADMLEIVDITDDQDNFVICDVSEYSEEKNTMALCEMYQNIECEIQEAIKFANRRQNVSNYIESYYYNISNVNKLIESINELKKSTNKIIVNDVRIIPDKNIKTNLESPAKEVYEFYHFCKAYTEEPEDDISKRKQKYIKKLLLNEKTLTTLEESIRIINQIKTTYLK